MKLDEIISNIINKGPDMNNLKTVAIVSEYRGKTFENFSKELPGDLVFYSMAIEYFKNHANEPEISEQLNKTKDKIRDTLKSRFHEYQIYDSFYEEEKLKEFVSFKELKKTPIWFLNYMVQDDDDLTDPDHPVRFGILSATECKEVCDYTGLSLHNSVYELLETLNIVKDVQKIYEDGFHA